MSSIVVAVIFVLGTAISPLLLAAFINKQSRRDKAVESAERAKVAKQVADAAELLKTAQSEAARLAAEAAADLIATTADLTARTDEVARLAAQKGSTAAPSVMGPTRCVMLEYPNGNRQEITLSGVPRIGESIRRTNGPAAPAYEVMRVLWLEDVGGRPSVVMVVHPIADDLPG